VSLRRCCRRAGSNEDHRRSSATRVSILRIQPVVCERQEQAEVAPAPPRPETMAVVTMPYWLCFFSSIWTDSDIRGLAISSFTLASTALSDASLAFFLLGTISSYPTPKPRATRLVILGIEFFASEWRPCRLLRTSAHAAGEVRLLVAVTIRATARLRSALGPGCHCVADFVPRREAIQPEATFL
jgi:hypothetical protein